MNANGDADAVALSIIVPAFNEAEALERAIAAIVSQAESIGKSFEVLVVDDGSRDATQEILQRAARTDPRIVPVTLSRNFGKEAAMQAGLDAAHGQAAILIDADLQHPPGLIPEMVALWQAGADVVDAVKAARGRQSAVQAGFAALFNWAFGRAIGDPDFGGASDYKLLDREVIETLQECPERSRFLRGLVAWVGFRHERIEFDCAERAEGASKWSFYQLLRYSFMNLIAFTSAPLKMVALLGFAVAGFGAVLVVQTLWRYFAGEAVTGFTTVIVLLVIFSGMILLSLGVIALYLAQMYKEQKARPLYVVRGRRAERVKSGEQPDGGAAEQ